MTIREQIEKMEHETLSEFATQSSDSRGRDVDEPQCDIRPLFQRDRDRILHCKAFRRLKNKTQVFLSPMGDHYRTRLSHTLEVSQNARTIAKALRMNEDLTEAIALGHDLGHTPFGHAGEAVLNNLNPDGFIHAEQSVRLVEKLEKDGEGLNLTWEVRDGMRNHRSDGVPATPEGKIVQLSDKIAYINSDIDDAIRANILSEDSIPLEIRKTLGFTSRERLDTLIHDVIIASMDSPEIRNSTEIGQAKDELRAFMFKNVYKNHIAKAEEEKAKILVEKLYEYYLEHIDLIPNKFLNLVGQTKEDTKERIVCDYISGMTDQYAIAKYSEFFMPKAWSEE